MACGIGEADKSKTLLGLHGGDGACWQTRDDRVNVCPHGELVYGWQIRGHLPLV